MISAALTLAGLSLLGMLLLIWAANRYPEDQETLPALIDQMLPQTQCAQCGYAGCRPYAEAIAQGAPINRCPPGGEALIKQLSDQLNRPVLPLASDVPNTAPKQVARINEPACIGCTLCIQACPVDAIIGAQQMTHTVLADACTGCELCLPPCPVDCIDLISLDETVGTASLKPAPSESRQPCIRCGECEPHCPKGLAPHMLFLHRSSETVAEDWGLNDCIECRWCDRVCPADLPLTQIFRDMKEIEQSRVTAKNEANALLTRFEAREKRLSADQSRLKTRPGPGDANTLLTKIRVKQS
ncbi:MAG: electron transport complex subunit RsxB [Pseudomonadales bacterium]|jgi:electron transport complex protein RnfB